MEQKEYIEELFKRLQKNNPFPRSDLDYTNNYTFLVAVVLSAQSTDKGVNKATKKIFEKISTPQDLLNYGLENFRNDIQTIGLYNNKALNIMKLSQILIDQYNGIVPHTREELETLPGVGQKSANVILNVCFDQPTIGVDTHIFRIAHRLRLSNGKNPLAVEQDLIKKIPQKYMNKASHWLVLHGRYVCKAKKPACATCILNDICPSNQL